MRGRGEAPRTVVAYRATLRCFLLTVEVDRAEDVTAEHVYAYLRGCRGLATESRHRYFHEVRCFFNWLVDAGYIEKSPFRGMKNVRLPQRVVQPFAPDDLARLLGACGEGEVGRRDGALLMLLLDTGARCSEVVQLEPSAVDLDDGRIRVLHGKGNKQRVVPIRRHLSRGPGGLSRGPRQRARGLRRRRTARSTWPSPLAWPRGSACG